MSNSGRRRRGSGGHPARVAARRQRNQQRHQQGPAGLARGIARTAARIDSALEAELWASQMLGMFERGRFDLPLSEGAGADMALEYGAPLLEQFARLDDPGAAIATLAIAELDGGELGMAANETLETRNMWRRLPPWAADVGASEIVAAAVMRDTVFDDARTVFLESRHADGQRLAVGVLVDNNLGGMAKDVLLADSIEQVAAAIDPHAGVGELLVEELKPGVAAGLIHAAIALTDMTWDPPVTDEYWAGRALALLRADQTPHLVSAPEPPELPVAEREALQAEFLSSPEGAGFSERSDEAWVAGLAIEFASGHLAKDPLLWSPPVIELFMLDWVPRKVATTDETLAALPGALDAWVRFCARKREFPADALAASREAIGDFTADFVELASDPEAADPSKQFILAAQAAGIDLEDHKAVEDFIAGWNARSGLDEAAGAGRFASRDRDHRAEVIQLKISLRGISKPPVWRRLQVAGDTRLDELHRMIQAAFGWEDYHLHVFELDGEQIGPADPDLDLDFRDERDFTLAELVEQAGDKLTYVYDFGDDWRHNILVEQISEPIDGVQYPLLMAAKGACPPEDCGGAWGYQNLKAALADPEHDQHAELSEWLGQGADFDPTAVDLDELRARLDQELP